MPTIPTASGASVTPGNNSAGAVLLPLGSNVAAGRSGTERLGDGVETPPPSSDASGEAVGTSGESDSPPAAVKEDEELPVGDGAELMETGVPSVGEGVPSVEE